MVGGDKMANKDYTVAMKNAEASVRMEGLNVTSEMQAQCQRVLDGESTTADVLMQLLSERERQSLRNALASTRMEGFEVTEQMVSDCVRLMRGEVSVEELVDKILKRP